MPAATPPELEGNRPAATSRTRVFRHRPHPHLRGLVAGIVGFQERASGPRERRQPAGALLPLVLSFGDPLEVTALSEGEGTGTYSSFVAGFMTGHTATRYVGTQRCVQVYLTPEGASRLLGVPGSDLARRVVAVDDVAPFLGGSLPDRLDSASSWAERIALVEGELLSALAESDGPDPLVDWMWDRIRRSGGRARIGDLVADTGWSHRHVTARFARRVGVGPKAAAGVIRFERAAAELGRIPLPDLAVRHGYADQSHLTREMLRYAGEPPARLAGDDRPTAYTALGTTPA